MMYEKFKYNNNFFSEVLAIISSKQLNIQIELIIFIKIEM